MQDAGILRCNQKFTAERGLRSQISQPVCPLYEAYLIFKRLYQAQLITLIRGAETVEIDMPNLFIFNVIGLHKCECGRRYILCPAKAGLDYASAKRAFSSPNWTLEQ